MQFLNFKVAGLLAAFLFTVQLSYSQRIFVSARQGDDKWSGTTANRSTNTGPLATLQEAIRRIKISKRQLNASDTIYIMLDNSEYFMKEPFTISPDDTHNWNIVIQSTTNTPARISGAARILLPMKKNIAIQAVLLKDKSLKFEQLYAPNGVFLQRAREPNSGFMYTSSIKEDTIKPGADKGLPPSISRYRVKSAMLSQNKLGKISKLPPADIKNILTTLIYKWSEKKVYVDKVNLSEEGILTQPRNGMTDFVQWGKGIQFYMENSLAFMDSPDEWFLDKNGKLYFYSGKKTVNANVSLYAPITETLLSLKGTTHNKLKNITFRNVIFEYSALFTPKDGFVNQQTVPYVGSAVIVNYADNIIFDRCEFRNLANNAVWFKTACSNSQVSNSYFHDLGTGAVKIGDYKLQSDALVTNGIKITNNVMHAGGEILFSAPAIAVYLASRNQVTNNTIFDFKYTGISNGFTWGDTPTPNNNNYFAFNNIHHLGWGIMDDLAGIYSVGNSKGTKIEQNVIHDIYCYRYGGNGLYLDEGSSGISISNNIVYNCESAGLMCGHAKNSMITNNIFADNQNAQIYFGYAKNEEAPGLVFTNNIIYWSQGKLFQELTLPKFTSDHNCYWVTQGKNQMVVNGLSLDSWRSRTGKDKNSIIADPQFRKGDYTKVSPKVANAIGFKAIRADKAGAKTSGLKWKNVGLTTDKQLSFKKSVAIKTRYNSRY